MTAELPSIDQLRELPLPDPISYLPQTWGWAMLGIVLLWAAVLIAWFAWKRRRRNLYRRQALVELDRLAQAGRLDREVYREVPVLLKRVAVSMPHVDGRVAALHGEAWIEFLRATGGHGFTPELANTLASLAYGPTSALDAIPAETLEQLIRASRDWLQHLHAVGHGPASAVVSSPGRDLRHS